MRITMICIGSLGDVKPYIILGRELQARGHSVSICAFSDFRDMVEQNGLIFHPISGDARDFIASAMKPNTKGVSFLNEVRASFIKILKPFLNDLVNASSDAEAIIATYFGSVFQSIAEMHRVPFVQTHFFPMDANDVTPISSAPGQGAGRMWYRTSYKLGYLLINTLERLYLSDWRKENGMSPRKLESKPSYSINGHTIPVLYAMSPTLMPRPATWGENIQMTGFWVDEREEAYQPPEALRAFLDAGEPPVYIGFGSMTSGDMGETLSLVLRAIAESGVRAVISKGWGVTELPASDNVFVMDGFVPHDWLFRQVSAVVHHGGAGTTAAGLIAGKPTLVIPFGGDQPFWAMRVRMLGLGPKPIPREKLTTEKLVRGLRALTSIKSYAVAAQELGERLRMENGVVKAADIVEREVGRWLAEDAKEE